MVMTEGFMCCVRCGEPVDYPLPDVCPHCQYTPPPPMTKEKALETVKKILEAYENRQARMSQGKE